MNSVSKIHEYLDIQLADPLEARILKAKLRQYLMLFFQEQHYRYWVAHEFNGKRSNKTWLLDNRQAIMRKIFKLGKIKFVFNKTRGSDVDEMVDHENLEGIKSKKVKIENKEIGDMIKVE
jgi:hypothetical protein